MTKYLILFFSLSLFIYIAISEIRSVTVQKRFKIINVFNITYGLAYGLLPILYVVAYFSFGWRDKLMDIKIDFTDDGLFKLLLWVILSCVSYFFIQLVYHIGYEGNRGLETVPNLLQFKKKRDLINIQILLLIILPLGLFSMFMWSKAYGGIFGLIEVGSQVRSGTYNVYNKFTFLKHPTKLIVLSTYLSIVLIKNRKNVAFNIVVFVISAFFSILYFLANDGRMSTACFFVTVYFLFVGFFERKEKFGWKILKLLVVFLLCIFFIAELDNITSFIKTGEIKRSSERNIFEKVLYEYQFVPISAQTSVANYESVNHIWLFFNDVVSGIFAWLPSSLKPDWLVNIWTYNTDLAFGSSNWSGQIPCDFVTTSIYDFGYIGVFIFAVFWGVVIRKIDNKFEKNDSMFFNCIYYVLFLDMFRIVTYCMLYDFILNLFYVFVGWVILKVIQMFNGKVNNREQNIKLRLQ